MLLAHGPAILGGLCPTPVAFELKNGSKAGELVFQSVFVPVCPVLVGPRLRMRQAYGPAVLGGLCPAPVASELKNGSKAGVFFMCVFVPCLPGSGGPAPPHGPGLLA